MQWESYIAHIDDIPDELVMVVSAEHVESLGSRLPRPRNSAPALAAESEVHGLTCDQ